MIIICRSANVNVATGTGFEPRELLGRPAFELVHPEEFSQVKQMH